MTELENEHLATIIVINDSCKKSTMNVKTSGWKFVKEQDIYIISKYLPQNLAYREKQ